MGGRGSSSGISARGGGGVSKQLPEYRTISERIEYIRKNMDISEDKAQETYNALNDFFNGSHREIREEGPGGYRGELIEDYISSAPKWNGRTYRGIGMFNDQLDKIKPGDEINMGGLASWSTKKDVAAKYATRNGRKNLVIFQCESQPKGTGVAHLAQFHNESEVLVSGKAKYKVTSIKKSTTKVEAFGDILEKRKKVTIVTLKAER